MNRQVVVRMVVVLFVLMGFGSFPLKAQKIYATDTETGEKTFVLTYGWGITGYASSHGISAWDVDGKDGGVANLLKAMCYSSSSEVGYGGLLYGNTHSQRFQAEGVKERVNLIYVAPQVSYLKRATMFPSCFSTMGGGVGYLHYRSKTALSAHPDDIKVSASSAGVNGFIGFEYTFARHWGISLEVDALYSPVKLGKGGREPIPFKPRGKFGLFLLTTQIGLSCHL